MRRWRNTSRTAREVLPHLKKGTVICGFDTETTGLPKGGKIVKIIQFSAIKVKVLDGYKLEEIDRLDVYINPEEPLEAKITEITGITDEMLADAPDEFTLAPIIFTYMEQADVWAAYNARFDLQMIQMMSERTGIPIDLGSKYTIDALEFSRDWLNDVPNHKLETTYKRLFPDGNIQFHSAIEDVKAMIEVMEALLPCYRKALIAEEKEQASPKKEIRIEKAYAWINPHNTKQQRICLKLSDGNTISNGDIFYDAVEKCWSHKATTYAKKLFESLNMADIEQRVLRLCSNYYVTFTNIDDLARSRISWLRKKIKETA